MRLVALFAVYSAIFLMSAPGCSSVQAARSEIIGGQADVGDPAVVALLGYGPTNTWICTGTLVTRDAVLTAAHCVQNAQRIRVIFEAASAQASMDATSWQKDELFDVNNLLDGNDLAVVWVNAPYDVDPIPIYTAGDPIDYTNFRMVGFGLDEVGHQGTKREARATGLVEYGLFYGTTGTTLPCFGDSGGPGLVTWGGRERVAGVVSFGEQDKCVQEAYYTKVGAYRSFLEPLIGWDGPPPPRGCSFCGFGVYHRGGEGWMTVCGLLLLAWLLTRSRTS